MLPFLSLCLLSRLAYSLNDVLVGRLARSHGRLEVAALRGAALGVTMAPLLYWVPWGAWPELARRAPELALTCALTAGSNLLQNHAARLLPFGLRAAFLVSGTSAAALLFGFVLGDALSWQQIALAVLLVGSAVAAAPGSHARHEIEPDLVRGAAVTFSGALLMACIAVLARDLSRRTHPLLTAWAWEFGSGLLLLPIWLWRSRRDRDADRSRRAVRILIASSPTVIGSGASMLALTLGPFGLWAAMGGTQVLFTALLGATWHRESVGPRRWACFGVAAVSVAGLALVAGSR